MATRNYFSKRHNKKKLLGRTKLDLTELSIKMFTKIITDEFNGINLILSFPEECPDNNLDICGFDWTEFSQELLLLQIDLEKYTQKNFIKGLENQFELFDIIEFVYDKLKATGKGNLHSYFRHYHYFSLKEKNDIIIKNEFENKINEIFKAQGIAYDMKQGSIERIFGTEIDEDIDEKIKLIDKVQDEPLKTLIKEAISIFRDPSSEKIDGISKLADALERSKTILDSNKKSGAKLLLNKMTSNSKIRGEYESEMLKLTEISNSWSLRHLETTQQVSLKEDYDINFLFYRYFNFLMLILRILKDED